MSFFSSARQRAFEHLKRFFTVQKNACPTDVAQRYAECWFVELEIDKGEEVVCLCITVGLEQDFPLSLPHIYLTSKEDVARFGYPPNVHTNGFICTFDANTNIPDPEAPHWLVEVCVRKAKKIIEDGLNRNNLDAYTKEFVAYWENSYQSEQLVDTQILSLIDEENLLPNHINYVSLKKQIGNFHALLYSTPQQFQIFRDYLKNHEVSYTETPTFFLGHLEELYPPFNYTNKYVLDLIQRLGLFDDFKEYLKSAPNSPIVTFAKKIETRNLLFGWKHKVQIPRSKHSGNRTRKISRGKTLKLFFDKQYNSKLVDRFSPQVFTHNRLVQRTAADYDGLWFERKLTVLVAGLGSIGSNLISFLESTGLNEFYLIDPDVLKVENIGRHLLGINYVGDYKVEAIRNYLQQKNPLIGVKVRKSKVVQLANQEPNFLSDCNYHFFCTGDVNAETWLAQNLHISDWGRPSFFIWVEPYLAGGHCVYLSNKGSITWDNLFDNHKFINNVISNEMHNIRQFTKQEAGCQTTYLPYDGLTLKLFLSALFPKIVTILKEEKAESRCFSWVGDLTALRNMNIDISKQAEDAGSYTILERLLC